jgi:Amt family ammonium transporter
MPRDGRSVCVAKMRSELDLLLFDSARLSAGALSFFLLIGVVLMQLGFCRAKNVVSILLAQVANLALASLVYALLGFGLMYGASRGWMGTDSFLARVPGDTHGALCFLLCQTLICTAAGAIAQGGLVERAKLGGHVALTLLVSLLIYPLFGSWIWGSHLYGGGWLEAGPNGLLGAIGLPPFRDGGGSSAVHGVGGWVALAASLCIGPRAGKFAAAGRELPLLGHSMVLVALGGLCFWVGSFGLQLSAALELSALDSSLPRPQLALPLLNTQLAGASGAAAAMLTSWRINGKPDIGVSISGGLAGLVAIGAGASLVTVRGALALGFVAGVLVVAAILWAERRGIDDPVGASSVHAVAGAWGCLALALFHRDGPSWQQLAAQAIGVLVCFAWSFGLAFAAFRTAMAAGWLRVAEQAEQAGLDLWEHDAEAYPPDLQPAGVDER